MKINIQKFIGISFLVFQIGMIVYARFSPYRYFVWAPHDSQNEFELSVMIDGRILDKSELMERYVLSSTGRDPRSIEHVKARIRQYQSTYGKDENIRAVLRYKTNGIQQEDWTWPPVKN